MEINGGRKPTLGGAYVPGLMHWLTMTQRHWLVAYLVSGVMAGSGDGPVRLPPLEINGGRKPTLGGVYYCRLMH